MTTHMHDTDTAQGPDEFDLLLNEELQSIANLEMPQKLRVNLQTRVWVREAASSAIAIPASSPQANSQRASAIFSPADFRARMHPPRDARSTSIAVLLHAAAIGLIFWGVASHEQFTAPANLIKLTELTPPPPIAPAKAAATGGGGGLRSPAPVSKGQLPKFADQQITAPKAPPLIEPKTKMPDATIVVQEELKMANNTMPNLGMPNSPLLGASMGNGSGTGIGSGYGSGLGLGTGGNYGGGLRKIGGGVSAPQLFFSVEPEFSEEARKAKTSGNVLVNLIVDAQGRPQNVHVLRGVGMGLDEKAVAAVLQYKFKPATDGGIPVAVELNVEVNFQIF